MKIIGKLCKCWLCMKSSQCPDEGVWHPCGCQIKEDYYYHQHPVQGVRVGDQIYAIKRIITTGGRNALWIYLDNGEDFLLLPAKQVGKEIRELNGLPVQIVGRFPASVHGCGKVKLHQEIVVWRPTI
jgi:hypothetical protein